MLEFLIFLPFVAAAFWANWARGAPWRRYHKAYIAPLETKIKAAKSKRAEKERCLVASRAKADLFTQDFRDDVSCDREALGQLPKSGQDELHCRESIQRLEMEIAEIDAKIEYLNSRVSHAKSFFRNQKELNDPYDNI